MLYIYIIIELVKKFACDLLIVWNVNNMNMI